MAEGTSLLRMHTAYTCIVSSNLTVSARNKRKSSRSGAFFLFWAGTSGPSAWPTREIRRAGRTSPSPLRIAHLLCAKRTAPRAAGARSYVNQVLPKQTRKQKDRAAQLPRSGHLGSVTTKFPRQVIQFSLSPRRLKGCSTKQWSAQRRVQASQE